MTAMKTTDPFPRPGHDHHHCMAAVLARAETLCRKRALRLTALRKAVLQVVASSHVALGAYDIVEEMARSGSRPAPISVYRALDFLIDQRLVHRLASRNAFVACTADDHRQRMMFLICERCDRIAELPAEAVFGAIDAHAGDAKFDVSHAMIEVAGTCGHCAGTA